jgi:hypothetical protein
MSAKVLVCAVASLFVATGAWAQTQPLEPPAAAPPPTGAPPQPLNLTPNPSGLPLEPTPNGPLEPAKTNLPHDHFAITPRFQWAFNNFIQEHKLSVPTGPFGTVSASQAEIPQIPLGGVTLEYGPAGWNTDFLLTGLYGKASADENFFQINTVPVTLFSLSPTTLAPTGVAAVQEGFFRTGSLDVERIDVELLARYRPPEKEFYWLYGARYVQLTTTTHINQLTLTPTFGGATGTPFVLPGVTDVVHDRRYMLEGGVGYATPLTSDGKLNLFGNGVLGVGYVHLTGATEEEFIAPSTDLSLGVSYNLTENVDAAFRYRAFIIYNTSQGDFEAVHGPEVSLTWRF